MSAKIKKSLPASPDFSTLPDDVARLEILKKMRVIIRAAAQHSSWIDKQCGVNGAQLWIMQELYDAKKLRIGELTKKLAVHQTTTSNLVDGLEKKRLNHKKKRCRRSTRCHRHTH